MTRRQFSPKLSQRVDRGVDRTLKRLLGGLGRRDDSGERSGTDDHKVEVAAGILCAAGDGTIDEGGGDLRIQRSQGLAEDISGTDGFEKHGPQFGEDGAGGIRLKIDMAVALGAQQNARGGQAVEFALHLPYSQLRETGDFAQVIRFVGMTVEQAKDSGLGLCEERVGQEIDRAHCTHIGYKCI